MRVIHLGTIVATGILLFVTGIVTGDDEVPAVYQEIVDRFPGVEVEHIQPSPVPGLLQISIDTDVIYVTDDGQYLIQGDIYDMVSEQNLTDIHRAAARVALLDSIDEASMLVFEPDETKFTVTVFTDIDCPYCRRFHSDMQDLHARGIRVRYLFFPRAGPGSDAWAKADAVWCAADRNVAMTRAKLGDDVEPADCGTTPVARHYELGKLIGIQGTPAILTDSGELIGGYAPAEELEKELTSLASM